MISDSESAGSTPESEETNEEADTAVAVTGGAAAAADTAADQAQEDKEKRETVSGSGGARPRLSDGAKHGDLLNVAGAKSDDPPVQPDTVQRKKNRHLSFQDYCRPSTDDTAVAGSTSGRPRCRASTGSRLPPTPDSLFSPIVSAEDIDSKDKRAEDEGDRPPPPVPPRRFHLNRSLSIGNGACAKSLREMSRSDTEPHLSSWIPPNLSRTKVLKKRLTRIFKGRRRNSSPPTISAPMKWRALPDPPPMDMEDVDETLWQDELTAASRPEDRPKYKKNLILSENMRQLANCGWYWGPMSWDHAQSRLALPDALPDGSFLVRDSSDDHYIFSLSFRSQGMTHHTRIEHCKGKFSFWAQQQKSSGTDSIVEFIEKSMRHSANGHYLYFMRARFPGLAPYPVKLLYPISRFSRMRSLQHMCRFVVRQQVRIDLVKELPLPKRLLDYLLQGLYYYSLEDIQLIGQKEAAAGADKKSDRD